jgi:glycine dehydrogenase
MSAFYAMWHGPTGLREIAMRVNNFASRLQVAAQSRNGNVFDTVTVDVSDAAVTHSKAAAKGINFARVSATKVRISFDEETTEDTFAQVLDVLGLKEAREKAIPASLLRTSSYLTHPVFNTNHSNETVTQITEWMKDAFNVLY